MIPTGEIVLYSTPWAAALLLAMAIPYFSKRFQERSENKLLGEVMDLEAELTVEDQQLQRDYEMMRKGVVKLANVDVKHAAYPLGALGESEQAIREDLKNLEGLVIRTDKVLTKLDPASSEYAGLNFRRQTAVARANFIYGLDKRFLEETPLLTERILKEYGGKSKA